MGETAPQTAKDMIQASAAKTPEQRAQELFGSQGFCVIKRFLSVQEVRGPKDRYKEDRRLHRAGDSGNVGVSYFFKTKIWKEDVELFRAARRVFLTRNEILATPHGESLRREYPQAIFPDGDKEKIIDRMLEYHFIRASKVVNGEAHVLSNDPTGPLLGLILLTKKGIDYTGGGLILPAAEGRETVDLDELSTPGDLILLDTRRVSYKLQPVTSKPGQIGRLELFFPLLTPQQFAGGKDYYYFKQNKFKLHYFQTQPVSRRIQDHIRHFQSLILGKTKAVDEGYRQ